LSRRGDLGMYVLPFNAVMQYFGQASDFQVGSVHWFLQYRFVFASWDSIQRPVVVHSSIAAQHAL
jgi:hypothetical protein